MENLYVIEQGSYLAKSGNSLKIMKKGTVLEAVPASDLNKLVLTGYVSLTGPVLDYLIQNRGSGTDIPDCNPEKHARKIGCPGHRRRRLPHIFQRFSAVDPKR